MPTANTVIVLDFETTGLSPNMGDRAIEIGAVKLVDGEVVETFQQLMNPGFKVSSFIEGYTGITNRMLADAPSCAEVMTEFHAFIADDNLVAHNASFDKRFLDAEFERIGRDYTGDFACSLLVSRRLNQDAPSHKLGDLVRYKQIDNDGVFHRALADSQMTAKLWLLMLEDIQQRGISTPSFSLMLRISKTQKGAIAKLLEQQRG
ncbi:PolC-type DNA polymerase III [Vibrio sinaloensis]|uniref:3'-5' exonuclease n=1 Tax=Photobacterium sp. (strain ATCC 43367) TaxID=379097 RepID=UPI0022AF2754|nr:3'-5' exonuclease [Vibrio sinaloensis]MCZ4292988.1 3'-5' exonuclease [Vibrio sinaloensis]